jgi:hypothetical protein
LWLAVPGQIFRPCEKSGVRIFRPYEKSGGADLKHPNFSKFKFIMQSFHSCI